MASLTAEPTTATADAPPLSAKEYAAQRTRRRSSSGSSITVGRIVKTPTTTITVAPSLTGNFSGTGTLHSSDRRILPVTDSESAALAETKMSAVDDETQSGETGNRDDLLRLPEHVLVTKILTFLGYKDYTLTARTCQ